jgi:hypothetical protein
VKSDKTTPSLGSGRTEKPHVGRTFTRRRFIAKALGWLGVVGLSGLVGYELPRGSKSSGGVQPDYEEISQIRTFVSRPDLRPPVVKITSLLGGKNSTANFLQPRFIFVSPRTISKDLSQPGLMILDRQGRMVWFNPILTESPFDFDAQDYRGHPRLTWWQGQIVSGHGIGVGGLADDTYETVDTVRAGAGLKMDCHELVLTSKGTALITAYEETTTDLSALGGARNAKVWSGHAQEIDLATGKVLLDWSSLDHVGVEESYAAIPSSKNVGYDYFHINSVSEASDGNLLIAARNTWAIYKIHRSSGHIIWRMNGKKSDFTMGPGAGFYWQHDAGMPRPATLTVFDDGAFPSEEKQSRALVLSVDTEAMHVSLDHAYVHPAGFIAANQGSVQLLADGRVFVGWGNQPYFSEFAPDGTLLLDGEFPSPVRSYRAFTRDWVGRPTEPPSIAVRTNAAGGAIVYVSWNGATEIDSWTILAGKDRSSLRAIGSQEWTGFETAAVVNSTGSHFAAVAIDNTGKEIGRSATVKLNA